MKICAGSQYLAKPQCNPSAGQWRGNGGNASEMKMKKSKPVTEEASVAITMVVSYLFVIIY